MPEASLPPSVYLVLGILTIGNLGVILTCLTVIFKAGKWVAKTDAGIADAKDCAVRAHLRIDANS